MPDPGTRSTPDGSLNAAEVGEKWCDVLVDCLRIEGRIPDTRHRDRDKERDAEIDWHPYDDAWALHDEGVR